MNVERVWLETLLKMQGPDGLIYTPLSGRDWVLPPKADIASGSPGSEGFEFDHFALIGFGTARTLGGDGETALRARQHCAAAVGRRSG